MRPVRGTAKDGVTSVASAVESVRKNSEKPKSMSVNGADRGDLAMELLRMQADGVIDPLEQNTRREPPLHAGWTAIQPTVLTTEAFSVLEPVDLKQDSARKLFNKRGRVDSAHSRGRDRSHSPHMIPKPPSSLYSWSFSDWNKSRTLAALAPQLRFPPEQLLLRSENELSMRFAQGGLLSVEERSRGHTLYYPRKTPRAYDANRTKNDKLFKIYGRTSWISKASRDLLSSEACVVARGGMDPFREHGSTVSGIQAGGGNQSTSSCVDIVVALLDGACLGVNQSDRFTVVRVDEDESTSDSGGTTSSSFDGTVPNVLVGFDGSWLSVTADLLNSWEHAHFEPYIQTSVTPLNYITIRLCRSSEYDSCCHEKWAEAVDRFFTDLAALYEDCCQQTMVDVGEGGIDLCAKDSGESLVEETFSVAATAELDRDSPISSGIHFGQAYTQMWLNLLKKVESTKLCTMLRERAMKAKCTTILVWIILPIESSEWIPFFMNAVAKCTKCLKDAGIEAQFQLVPGESVLPWRRNKSEMHSIVTSLFMKCNKFGTHSELVILDSENASKRTKSEAAAHEEGGEISDSDNDMISEEELGADIEPCVHVCCAYSRDQQWLTVGWTDESGSFLHCESHLTENMAAVTAELLKKSVEFCKRETACVVIAIMGADHSTILPLWKSAMEKPIVRDNRLHFLLCSVVVGRVDIPVGGNGGKTLYKVQATHGKSRANTESILWISSLPSRRDLALSTSSSESALGSFSVLHVARIHEHTAPKQSLPGMKLSTAVDHFKRLAWLSRGSFKERPLTCVPLHMSCATRLAHWLNGSSKLL